MLWLWLACVAAREAYVTAAGSADASAAPNYIFGALALIGTINAHDSTRDIIVLIDDITLAVYPMIRGMFERNNATVIKTTHLSAANSLRSAAPANWIGAFTKMSVFQLLLGYSKLLFLDADGVLLNSADAIFALPLSDDVEMYGMRDVYSCNEPDDTPAFMSACFMWNGETQVSLANRLTNTLVSAADAGRRFYGGQRLLSEVVGSRLVMINESLATCTHRCSCKRQSTGLTTLRDVVYSHFMKQTINMIDSAQRILKGKPLAWQKTTMYSSHEADCTGIAYRAWETGFRRSMAAANNSLLFAATCTGTMSRDVCSDFVQTSIFNTANLSHAYDGDPDTAAYSRHGGSTGDHFTLTLSINASIVEHVGIISGRVRNGTRVGALDETTYGLSVDGRDLARNGLVYRRVRTVTLRLKRGLSPIALAEFVVRFMPTPVVTSVRRTPNSQLTPATFRYAWRPQDQTPCASPWQCVDKLFDGNNQSAAHFPAPLKDLGLLFTLPRLTMLCGLTLLATDKTDGIAHERVFLNDGAIELGVVPGPTVTLALGSPVNVFNFWIAFAANRTSWLRIHEIFLLPPIGDHIDGCGRALRKL